MFLGDNLLPLLTLALGGAMSVGTALALVRPRDSTHEGELEQPPLARSIVMIGIGWHLVWQFYKISTNDERVTRF